MHTTIGICMAIMACLSLIVGFNDEGIFSKLCLVYGGWLSGWLFIMMHDEFKAHFDGE